MLRIPPFVCDCHTALPINVPDAGLEAVLWEAIALVVRCHYEYRNPIVRTEVMFFRWLSNNQASERHPILSSYRFDKFALSNQSTVHHFPCNAAFWRFLFLLHALGGEQK
jgi:hypothetical protein